MIAGNLGTIAAGQMARRKQDLFIRYGDVANVKINRRRNHVLVKGPWGEKSIGINCRGKHFEEVLRLLRERCTSAGFVGA